MNCTQWENVTELLWRSWDDHEPQWSLFWSPDKPQFLRDLDFRTHMNLGFASNLKSEWKPSWEVLEILAEPSLECHLPKMQSYTQCLKIKKVSFNIASEASFVYILSGQKLVKMPKMTFILFYRCSPPNFIFQTSRRVDYTQLDSP